MNPRWVGWDLPREIIAITQWTPAEMVTKSGARTSSNRQGKLISMRVTDGFPTFVLEQLEGGSILPESKPVQPLVHGGGGCAEGGGDLAAAVPTESERQHV